MAAPAMVRWAGETRLDLSSSSPSNHSASGVTPDQQGNLAVVPRFRLRSPQVDGCADRFSRRPSFETKVVSPGPSIVVNVRHRTHSAAGEIAR